jgi:signal transduction histidine kinase
MGMTSVALIAESGISIYHQTNAYKDELKADLRIFGELISLSVVDSLIEYDVVITEQNLKAFSIADGITNVHIYRVDEQGEMMFFASYNRVGETPIESMIPYLQDYLSPKMSNGFVNLAMPITNGADEVGYIFLRSSTIRLQDTMKKAVASSIIELSIFILIILFVTLKLQNIITHPLDALSQLAQLVSVKKEYSSRAPKSNIVEINMLTSAFNSMLDQVEEHIKKHAAIEEEYRHLHQGLEEKVNQRTLALKEANQELIQTLEKLHLFQRQMVENEKMASLGDMVAGVAHEVNTPIGLGVTASTMMIDRLKQLEQRYNDKQLKASNLERFIAESLENTNIIFRNLQRAAELISSFKQVAVDQTNELERDFAIQKVMDETLLSLRPQLKKFNHIINIDCDDKLVIRSKAGPISQIMINLIMNSISHGFEDMTVGQINISFIEYPEGQLKIIYTDNGKGISDTIAKRIFDPFVTTKRGQGGSGLGMHLVYNLVTQALAGSIVIKNNSQVGVEFHIVLPIKKPTETTHIGVNDAES